MKKRLTIALALTVATGSFQLAFADPQVVAADATKTGSKKQSKSGTADSGKAAAPASDKEKSLYDEPLSSIGLSSQLVHMINQGKWKETAATLEKKTAKSSYPSRDHAWLAFAYLFLGKCDELGRLKKTATKEAPEAPYCKLVTGFDLTCQGKFEEAEKLFLTLPPSFGADPLANFALSLVTAKQGKATPAAAYTRKAVELDPQFAWGFRTLGYLEQRWLEDLPKAEQAYAQALKVEPKMVEAQDALVDLRLLRNDFDGAIDAAQEAIKKAPSANSYYRLSQIYTEQWRLREALDLIKKAIAMDPNNPRFYRSRAVIKSFQGHTNEAIADQQKAVDLSKDKSFELIELSNMNVLAGNNNRAADNLKDALKSDPDNQVAHDKLVRLLGQEKRFDDLIEEGKRWVSRKPRDAKVHMELAQAYVSADKLDEAINEYKEAANLNQTDAEPHRRVGAIYAKKKDFSKAAKEYTWALNMAQPSVADLVSLGYCYAQNDDYKEAEAAFITALALYQLTPQAQSSGPSKLDIMRSLGALLLDEGRYVDAANQFENVFLSSRGTPWAQTDEFMLAQSKTLRDLSQNAANELVKAFQKLPDDAKELHKLALLDTLIKAGKAELARQFLDEKATHTDATVKSQWLTAAARLYAAQGDLSRAEESALKASGVEGQSYVQKSEALLALSEIYLANKQYDKAEESANKALEAYAKNYNSYVVLGRVALSRKDAKLAISQAERSLALNPYSASACVLIGDARLANDEIKDATASFQKAVQLYPSLLEAHRGLALSLNKLGRKDEAKKEEEKIAQLETGRK